MNVPPSLAQRVRLGDFDIDLKAGELYRRGLRIKLQEQPFQLLAALVERPGELVTREELREKLWPADTFVDFDGSLNATVNRLRDALDDSASSPRFIETLPRRGYRLIASIETVQAKEAPRGVGSSVEEEVALIRRRRSVAIGWAIAAVVLSGIAYWSLGSGTGIEPARRDERIMLGVLPLNDYGGEVEGAILAQALTDELITELGRQEPQQLGVIAGTSMRAYQGRQQPIDQIGKELGIDYVVEGGVRRSSEGTRITIRLVDVRSQAPVWMDDYDQELSEFTDVEREAAALISRALALQLLGEGEPTSDRHAIVDPQAYEFYLKGRYFREQMTEDGLRKGLEYFGKAIDRDSNYARAYAGLAGCYCLLGGDGIEVEPPHETLRRSEMAARQALQLDDSLAEAHAALGMISMKYRWDLPEARRRFERAIALNPSYAQAHLWYSLYHEVLGIKDLAIEYAAKARQLDPLSIPAIINLAHQYRRAHKYDEAIATLGDALELNRNSWTARWALGDCYVSMGRLPEAVAELAEAARLSEGNPAVLASLGYAHGRRGSSDAAREVVDRLKQIAVTRYVSPVNRAIVAVGLGDADEALAQLDLGYMQRSRSMAWLNVDERFDPLRHDTRFQGILAQVGIPSTPLR